MSPRNVPGTPWFPHIREKLQLTRRRKLVAVALLVVFLVAYVFINMHKEDQRLRHLLCETDYQALLTACRGLSQRVAAGDLEPSTYVLRYGWSRIVWRRRPDPETARFPRAVWDLDPMLVEIDRDGRVWVALLISPDQGVFAYPENYQAHGDSLGKVELIPGLWFWDDRYEPGVYPGTVSYMDTLIREGKEFQQSLRKKDRSAAGLPKKTQE